MYSNRSFDLVILGFGLVSKLFLQSISRLNLKIAIINRKPADTNQVKNSMRRGIALNYSSLQFLKRMHMMDGIKKYGNKIENILISEKNFTHKISISARDIKNDYLSYVVEESYLEKCFLEKIKFKNIYFFNNYILSQIKKKQVGWDILIKNKQQSILIKSNFFIGIDGTNSLIKKLMKIKSYVYDYENYAYIFNCNTKKKTKKVAFQKIFNNGIIACLPLKNNTIKIVMTVNKKEKMYLDSINNNKLKIYLKHLLGGNISEIKSLTNSINYYLLSIKSKEVMKKDLLLLGNAAITLNPITAQGFNLCIRDVDTFIYLFKKSQLSGKLKLSYKDLLYYQLKKNYEHNFMIKSINFIYYFFKTNYFISANLRNLVFMVFDNLTIIKKKFIMYKQGVVID